jgi:ABC-type Na+ transport system ATPase subunit NatA
MLDVTGISHTYGSGAKAHTALGDITFAVEKGEIRLRQVDAAAGDLRPDAAFLR